MIPGWYRRWVDEATPDQLAFKRYARLAICSRCMTRVLAATESYPIGRDVLCDTTMLNVIGEAWARGAGIKTFRLHGSTARMCELDWRAEWDIIMSSAGSELPSGTVIHVLMQHVCGLIVPPVYSEDAHVDGL